jgi:transglutaminase-like putative cysteine protease
MMGESTPGQAVPPPPDQLRVVSCDLAFEVVERAEVILQLVAASSAGRVLAERFEVSSNSQRVDDVVQLRGPHGTRLQVLRCPPGRLTVTYRSEIEPVPLADPDHERSLLGSVGSSEETPGYARLLYLRPSRYCPSDHLVGFAVAEFGIESTPQARVEAITTWIRERTGYVAGSSSVHDSAEDTLLTGMGTCRDFAHLGVALCRAVGVPARFVAVYAPGLYPMDFHAVFEALEDGRWCAHDATDLAPRQAMVRIATGRDAADAAFASVNSGIASLDILEVTATAGGVLPVDDPSRPFELA